MNKFQRLYAILFVVSTIFVLNQINFAQTRGTQNTRTQVNRGQNNRNNNTGTEREEYTGNFLSYNGPRTQTGFFTLRLNGRTSDEQAGQYLGVLRDRGQDAALDAIRNNELGTFSLNNGLGRTLNVVRESTVDGRRRIFIVFERWMQAAEVRFGYRSTDYPFGVIELLLDPRTGRGEGTYIAAARIRFDEDRRNNNQQTVEIENFATYPVRLMNVRMEGNRR